MFNKKKEIKKIVLRAIKIGVGSSVALVIASMLELEQVAPAGTIALLTLMSTKWDTVRLSVYRILSFFIAVLLAGTIFNFIDHGWIGYGLYVFANVLIAGALDWMGTISVNALVGVHFLTSGEYTVEFVRDELLLVVIGVVIALIMNLFNDDHNRRQDIIDGMRYVEYQLQAIIGELAMYLSGKPMEQNVWLDMRALEADIQEYVMEAQEYQENTFQSHPGYYIDYFEMRYQQCKILHNLHSEMRKVRAMPVQAHVISEYLLYMKQHVVEVNIPEKQLEKLEELFEDMRRERLPRTREEFESRAILYHILMDIEDFLLTKKKFVDSLDEQKLRRYWDTENKVKN
ncbi:MAG: hypothetical protein HFH12_10780 [Dorea sp.]|nr:hypothetical protein [Dorea sp.]